jgi:hypothetical protein
MVVAVFAEAIRQARTRGSQRRLVDLVARRLDGNSLVPEPTDVDVACLRVGGRDPRNSRHWQILSHTISGRALRPATPNRRFTTARMGRLVDDSGIRIHLALRRGCSFCNSSQRI